MDPRVARLLASGLQRLSVVRDLLARGTATLLARRATADAQP
jgi:hypothetical protein